MKAILGSNLFRVDPICPSQFLPLHRTVAEFLGARWLAGQVDKSTYPSRTAKRLMGLISAEGGVPASLRGLHAWLPKFSDTRLGPDAIDRDPYGVLRYGDGDNLSIDQARQIIDRLKKLANFDPYFRNEWGNALSIRGLAHTALRDEFKSLIVDHQVPFGLRSLLLQALLDTDLAKILAEELEIVIFDPNSSFHERRISAEVLDSTNDHERNWPSFIKDLTALGDEDSKRLAVELLGEVGYDKFDSVLIARTVIAYSNILETELKKDHRRSIGSFSRLARSLPINRVVNLLDELTLIVLPTCDPEKWWADSYHEGWSEFSQLTDSLILRQLEHDTSAINPQQFWNWMRALERQRDYHRDERKGIAEILSNDSHLRRGVQRLALFEVQTESNFHSRYHHLSRHSDGLYLTDDDARFFIKELTENGNPEAREAWMAQVDQFRVDRKVPKEIQEIALPFADGDEELVSFLTERAKQPEYEKWELKHRKEERARERKKQKQFEVARKNYAAKVTEIKRGEREWLVNPAQAYLGLFNDLNSEAQPADRIAKWLGEELKGVVLIGFEAVLHRTDLPTGDEISKNFAKSIVLNFIYPMLAGAGRRMIEGRGFSDLSSELLSAISVAAENSLIENREGFEGLREALDRQLRTDPVSYERHIRRKYEPMLKAIRPHVSGLYGFVRSDLERPLSTKLSIEWLSNFPEIHLNIQHELAGCLINTPGDGQANARTALAKIARKKVKNNSLSDGDEKLWQGIHFLFDFDSALKTIPKVTVDTQEWLWVLAAHISPRDSREEQSVDTSINQLKWIVEEFRRVWIYSDRPTGVTSGDTNSWDATELLKQLIYQIAKDPSDEATLALTKLRDMQNDGYMVTIKGALAAQHRVRLEANFITPTFAALKAVLSNKRPQSAADIQAIVLDEFNQLQTKFRGDPFDIVNLFYDDAGKPRTENACRDRFLIALNKLPFGISTSPEVAMPKGRRSDAAFVYAQFAVPFEVKGQWHKEVWTAAATQLDRFYSIDYKAGGKGIYLVFWFGVDAPSGKRLKLPPNGATRPSSAKEMQVMLESNLPSHRRDDIATFVLDVTRV